jgi:hypothetical protein
MFKGEKCNAVCIGTSLPIVLIYCYNNNYYYYYYTKIKTVLPTEKKRAQFKQRRKRQIFVL